MHKIKNALEEENAVLRIKKISLIYLPILLVLFCLFSEGAHAQQAPPKKNVLVLHGQWRIRTYEIQFNSTLHNEFLASKAVTAGITHVYLGLEDFPDSVYPQNFIEELRFRVEKHPVDLVISFLPDANRFLLSYGQELFPGVPVIFAIPSTRDVQKINKLKNAVIIPSIFEKAMQNTVENIFSLLPDTRHLVVVCGDAPFDRNYLEVAKRAIASLKQDAKVSYLIGLPLDELWRRVSNLATGTAILFTTYDEEKNGKKHEASDVSALLAINANAPVFSVNGSLLGNGIVGGTITSPELYAKKIAEVALHLLQGSQPTEISTIDYAPFDVYDWRALKRWNISEDRLPSGSQVRYKTLTLWETYKVHIIVVIGVICLETMLIYALFISRMRIKGTKEALQESEERYRTLQENVPVGVYRTSKSGKFISLNPAAFKMFELDAEEDLSSYQTTDFYKNPEKRQDVLSQLKTEGKITDFEAEFRRKDGSLFWGSLSATQVTDKDGNFIFVDGVVQDITERKQAEEALKDSQEEARVLAGKLITTQEEERTRLARELHDDITQRLALMNIEVDKLELQHKSLSEPIKERLRQIGDNLGELSSDIEMISRQLHPSILDDLGLIQAIESECNNFTRVRETPVTSDLDTTLHNLSKEMALCIYRILQEGLRNIDQHARATDIQVQLSKKNNTVYFVLRDNGIGFDLDSSTRRRGLGLASMGERARLINGDLSIESRPGKGTVIKLEAPLAARYKD